ncbi:MAG: nucleotidyltransferase domain-containing protein [Nitrospirae bacterium]|nr:nucleotidyltransferase domain-containing protein [Nitrospirota bacterium]
MQKTALLDEYRKRKKEQTENLRIEMLKKIKAALSELSKIIYFKDAYVFGSILRPSFSEESDIDIAFDGLKDEYFFKTMSFLSDFLGRDVDVIQLEGHRLRDGIIKEGIKWQKPYFQKEGKS